MKTPLDSKYTIQRYEIDEDIIDNGYIIFTYTPDVNSVEFVLDECNHILGNDFLVEIVTEDNYESYPLAAIDQYVLSWKQDDYSRLQDLIESELYDEFHVRYVVSSE